MVINITILVVGLNRSLSYTAPSIVRRVQKPLEKSFLFSVRTNLAFIVPRGPVINHRSGEHGDVEINLPQSLSATNIWNLDEEDLQGETMETLEKVRDFPDWGDDNGRAVRNALTYMAALKVAYRKCLGSTDQYILVRPDLAIEGRLWLKTRLFANHFLRIFGAQVIVLPSWGKFGGLNDRFAIVPDKFAVDYFERDTGLSSWIQGSKGLPAELFLLDALRAARHVSTIATPMFRIRLGGVVESRDIAMFRRATWIRQLDSIGAGIGAALRRLFRQ